MYSLFRILILVGIGIGHVLFMIGVFLRKSILSIPVEAIILGKIQNQKDMVCVGFMFQNKHHICQINMKEIGEGVLLGQLVELNVNPHNPKDVCHHKVYTKRHKCGCIVMVCGASVGISCIVLLATNSL